MSRVLHIWFCETGGNREVLSRSSVFRALFSTNLKKESEIRKKLTLQNVNVRIMLLVWNYCKIMRCFTLLVFKVSN